MRVDKPQKQNTFNVILIAFFFLGSSNFLFIIFFKVNPIKYGNDFIDIITKYEFCQKKYGVVNNTTLQQISIEELVAISYGQKESIKNFRISSKIAEDNIRKDTRFHTNGQYDNKKLLAHLDHIRSILKIRITQKDYMHYKQIVIAKEQMDKIHKKQLNEISIGNLISNNCSHNIPSACIVEGYRIEIPLEQKNYTFTDNEIKAFIKEQIRQKVGFYIIGENVSGFIIKVPMHIGSSNITDGVNFFLKQEKFIHEELQSFMEQFYLESDGFKKTIDYKVVMNKWKQNGRKSEKNVNIKNLFEIEILDKVEENEDNKFIFDKESIYHKNFYPIGTMYHRVIIKEHEKEKVKTLTKEDINNYVIPTMIAIENKKQTILNTYNIQFNHNNGTKKIITNGSTKIELELPLYVWEKNYHNRAIVFYDGYDLPYIFVITNIKQKTLPAIIDKKQVEEYINNGLEIFIIQDIYFYLFNIYYSKIKNQFKA